MNIQPGPIIPNPVQPLVPIQPLINQTQSVNSALLIDSLINVSTVSATGIENIIPATSIPAPPTPPSGTQSRSMSVSEKAPSLESAGSATGSTNVEWAVFPQGPTKLKYTQIFNTTDRARTGYLTGAQARNLLLQSKLPQATLAQIWALSDIDSDGRLSCDEFVLAMYLCEMASQGETIPAKLPLELLPPSFKKTTSRQGSVTTSGPNSRHGSISSQGGTSADLDGLHNFNQSSFEDKRKENYDKGQAELERRRKVLQGSHNLFQSIMIRIIIKLKFSKFRKSSQGDRRT